MGNNTCAITKTVIYSCAGAYNVGKIANRAAVELQQEGIATMLCLSALSGNEAEARELAATVDRVVGIDGCEHACVKKSLEQVGLGLTDHVTVTDLSITKKPLDGTTDAGAVTRVKNAVRARLASIPGGHG
jgi:uncharacterized metal-binding protein